MRALRLAGIVVGVVAVVGAFGASTASAAKVAIVAKGTSVGVVKDGRLTMVVECDATGVGTFTSIAITECYTTNGAGAPGRALIGPATVTVGTGEGRLEPYSLCVRALAFDVDGNQYDTGLSCSGDVAGSALALATG